MSIRFEKILFPTDFSDLSIGALSFARELAETFDATIHCLYVVDEAYQYWSAMGPESIPVGPPSEDMIELGRTRMEEFRTEHLTGLKQEPVTHVALGRPFSEIIGYAREKNVDLIVMATHGRGPIAHALLGSTTERVVRKAQCAVLTVRSHDQDSDMS
ncbi:MAG: universal stress protein [Phycisphaerales bacterium]|nr:MAG: universal stress protein [Phycisphaerales bacterium]